jgi:hypothetical protein
MAMQITDIKKGMRHYGFSLLEFGGEKWDEINFVDADGWHYGLETFEKGSSERYFLERVLRYFEGVKFKLELM